MKIRMDEFGGLYCNFVAYAAVVGAEPPAEEIGPEGWWAWYARTRAALRDPT